MEDLSDEAKVREALGVVATAEQPLNAIICVRAGLTTFPLSLSVWVERYNMLLCFYFWHCAMCKSRPILCSVPQ
jgi:hypothetical protein